MIKSFLIKDIESICLIIITILLLAFGILAISSCSNMIDIKHPTAYFINHFVNIMIGCFVFFVSAFINYKYYKHFNFLAFIITAILLIIPFFCRDIKGANRWIIFSFISFNFQPSELAKIVLTIIMANFLARHKEHINNWKANVFPLIYLGVFCLIIYFQKDLGTIFLLYIVWSSLLFVAKIDTKRIIILCLVGIIGLVTFILKEDYRRDRVKVLMQPIIEFVIKKQNNDNKKNIKKADDYNSRISFAAFGSGGIFGKGAGNSKLKLNHLPEKHTDYIFAIIGEEYGLFGTLFIVILFMLYIKFILSIYKKCTDDFGKYLSFGIMLIMAIQSIINMGMTIGILPAKGFPLPFVSYGGSSMISNFCMLGILINISRNNTQNNLKRQTYS
jgi:cell division protein FtsW